MIVLRNHDVERLQVVAENTGKSIVLGLYESRIGDSFDRIEPFGVEIETAGRSGQKAAPPLAAPRCDSLDSAANGGPRAALREARRPVGPT